MADQPDRPKVQAASVEAGNYIESIVSAFQRELEETVLKAQAASVARLQKNLAMDGSTVLNTKENHKVLRGADKLFTSEMNKAGYPALVDGFVKTFDGTLPFFQDTVDAITENWVDPPPPVEWSASDLKLFTQAKLNGKQTLDDLVETIGSQATAKATFSVGGMSFGDLAQTLSKQFGQTLPQAVSLAATAQTTFYRTIADQGYQKIEQDLPGEPVFFTYQGPDDKLTRPFCRELLKQGKAWTREQIQAMDNGQLPGVMKTCGGYNCRHQWLLYVPSEEQASKLPSHLEKHLPPDFDTYSPAKKAGVVKKLLKEHLSPDEQAALPSKKPKLVFSAGEDLDAPVKPDEWDTWGPGKKAAWTKKQNLAIAAKKAAAEFDATPAAAKQPVSLPTPPAKLGDGFDDLAPPGDLANKYLSESSGITYKWNPALQKYMPEPGAAKPGTAVLVDGISPSNVLKKLDQGTWHEVAEEQPDETPAHEKSYNTIASKQALVDEIAANHGFTPATDNADNSTWIKGTAKIVFNKHTGSWSIQGVENETGGAGLKKLHDDLTANTANIQPSVELGVPQLVKVPDSVPPLLKYKPAKLIPVGSVTGAQTQSIMAAVRDAGLEGWFASPDNQLEAIKITKEIEGAPGVGGLYKDDTISLATSYGSVSLGTKLIPGESWNIAQINSGGLEGMQKTFVHELGHHIKGNLMDQGAIDKAFAKGNPITKYAGQNPDEYFGESFAAYIYHNAELKAFDPVGYKMIEAARASLNLPSWAILQQEAASAAATKAKAVAAMNKATADLAAQAAAEKKAAAEAIKNWKPGKRISQDEFDWRKPVLASGRKLAENDSLSNAFVKSASGGYVDSQDAKNEIMKVLAPRLAGDPNFMKLAKAAGGGGHYGSNDAERGVSALIQKWAGTSADHDQLAICMQRAVEDTFQLEKTGRSDLKSEYVKYDKFYQEHKEGLSAFVQAQYRYTQEWLKKQKIASVFAYRGMNFLPDAVPAGLDEAEVHLQPASSFSTSHSTARGFASSGTGMMLAAEIPAERILGTCRTGFGCLSESELVVLNGPGNMWVNSWRYKYGGGGSEAMSLSELLKGIQEKAEPAKPKWESK